MDAFAGGPKHHRVDVHEWDMCTCMCVNIYMCIYACMDVCMHVTLVYTYIYTYMYIYIDMYICVYIHIYTYIYIYTFTYLYIYIETVQVGIQPWEFNACLNFQLQLYTRLDHDIILRTWLAKNKQAVPTVQRTRVCTYSCV